MTSTTCADCGQYISCPSCDDWICCPCRAELDKEPAGLPPRRTSDNWIGWQGSGISPEHQALLDNSGETQSPEEMVFIHRMLPVQKQAISSTHQEENETITRTG